MASCSIASMVWDPNTLNQCWTVLLGGRPSDTPNDNIIWCNCFKESHHSIVFYIGSISIYLCLNRNFFAELWAVEECVHLQKKKRSLLVSLRRLNRYFCSRGNMAASLICSRLTASLRNSGAKTTITSASKVSWVRNDRKESWLSVDMSIRAFGSPLRPKSGRKTEQGQPWH